MKSIRIKNLRSFTDTEEILLKDINVIVGKNSAGKSSFLRIFPMFRQGIEERSRTPLLLYGKYVDFGSYETIKSKHSNIDDLLEFTFAIEQLDLQSNGFPRLVNDYENNQVLENLSLRIKFDHKYNLFLSEIELNFFNNSIKIFLDNQTHIVEKILINDKKYIDIDNKVSYMFFKGFVPERFAINEAKNKSRLREYAHEKIIAHIKPQFHGGTKEDTIDYIINSSFFIGDDQKMLESIKSIDWNQYWHKNTQKLTLNSPFYKELKNLIILKDIDYLLSGVNNYLIDLFLKIRYIAPVRATAERYYRIQDLAISEVDPHGKNLPMFLGTLSDGKLKKFQEWTEENFGFITKIKRTEGHYSIIISHKDGFDVNISDTGFGYSQILPIITQLWHSVNEKTVTSLFIKSSLIPKMIFIEQPELHLHPEFQAQFADVMVKVIEHSKTNKINLKLIIETHSQTIINRLGNNIINKNIDKEMVNIIIFDKFKENEPTKVSFASFDDDGFLDNWPVGFFHPSI